MSDQGTPYVGVFKDTDTLILAPAKNGGWVVSVSSGSMGAMNETIGAFTNAKDMMAALNSAFMTGATHD